ncbi:MAG: hypothetical protein VX656_14285 [Candidatus Latescibacterota bacterium]|nr:hypothetical protein [Candidatus Latescibacterota bacterium]
MKNSVAWLPWTNWIFVGPKGGSRPDNPGFVHAFHRQPDGQWLLEQIITPHDAQHHDAFGHNIVMSQGRALIAANCEDGGHGNPASSSVSVYLFELGQNDSWEQVEVFRSPDRRKYDPDGNDLFFGFGHFLIGSAGLDGIKGRRAKDIGALYVY